MAGVYMSGPDGQRVLERARYVVAAPGRGGAAWLSQMARENDIETHNNEVDIGVRVEVPNSVMDHLTQHLYEAKLVYYSDTFENKVRTFCMNPGGLVSEEHYEGGLAVVNGHSYADQKLRTHNTNFAMLVSTRFTEPFDQPIEYGRYIAQLGNMLTGGGVMVQRLGDLLKGRRTDASRLKKSTTIPTLETAVPGDLSFVLPHRHLTSIIEAMRAFDHVAPGLYSQNTLLYGVEVKFYSSKVAVGERFETALPGFYAIGDGAGVTRGLMQASVTGVVVARDIRASGKMKRGPPRAAALGGVPMPYPRAVAVRPLPDYELWWILTMASGACSMSNLTCAESGSPNWRAPMCSTPCASRGFPWPGRWTGHRARLPLRKRQTRALRRRDDFPPRAPEGVFMPRRGR